jgi:uncharacterized protein YcbX
MPILAQIVVYPIKSLDGHVCQAVEVLPGGSLRHDRQFAIVDSNGQWVNGKRYHRVVTLQATYTEDFTQVTLRHAGDPRGTVFALCADNSDLVEYLSIALGQRVSLIENINGGFPDDTEASGPTLVSWASLERIATWFPGLTAQDIRVRTRPNLVIDQCEPFWEDRLAVGNGVRFQVGSVEFVGMRICRRCVVPSLAPGTAERWIGFEREFMRRRWKERPPWSPLADEMSSYRFAINTRGLTTGTLRQGDVVSTLDNGG